MLQQFPGGCPHPASSLAVPGPEVAGRAWPVQMGGHASGDNTRDQPLGSCGLLSRKELHVHPDEGRPRKERWTLGPCRRTRIWAARSIHPNPGFEPDGSIERLACDSTLVRRLSHGTVSCVRALEGSGGRATPPLSTSSRGHRYRQKLRRELVVLKDRHELRDSLRPTSLHSAAASATASGRNFRQFLTGSSRLSCACSPNPPRPGIRLRLDRDEASVTAAVDLPERISSHESKFVAVR